MAAREPSFDHLVGGSFASAVDAAEVVDDGTAGTEDSCVAVRTCE